MLTPTSALSYVVEAGAKPTTLDKIVRGNAFEPSHGPRRRIPLVEAALAVTACAIALMMAASIGGNDPIAPTTFASAGIDCAPSPGATGQVFLKVKATDYEIIAARLAIASVPGVTIDQYLDHQGAFAQLACVFPDAPDLVHSIRPVDLPVSFAITADVADTNSAAHLRAIPNVRGVVTPESWSAWWTRIE
jgi:hypothetical protein